MLALLLLAWTQAADVDALIARLGAREPARMAKSVQEALRRLTGSEE